MRSIAAFTTSLLLGTFGAQAFAAADPVDQPLTPIASLDVNRYIGTWYEVAKFPNQFQKQCASDTTADYGLREDGRIRVVNRCRKADGSEDAVEGVARQIDGPTSPKLGVRFAPAYLSFLDFVWGDYWVIDLDEYYMLSAVSEPGRKYLWILSRTRQVDPLAYQALLTRLAAQGLDTSKLVPTPQND
jgi:apolipoprotein D and lipocalin family protein